MMNKVQLLCVTTALIASSSLWAADTANDTTANVSNAVPEKAMPYGDNPSLGRVLLYKTGKGMQNLGNSIQGASDNTSQKISERWQDTKKYTEEQSEVVQAQTEKAKQYTAKKWQDTKDAVVGTNEGNVPIERAELSQPSKN
ncbi:hypothetical protein [Acinetobacter proteolyticus]|uniref:hypothetical protein n=1 Tax=Acinetobacter proteolyticus TaxID=1776741 RepID=UPI00132EB5CC|nr:hypothetical protein [Acinetobacter proteolyticus]QHH93938.1 hypothetical protein FPL18_08890 [Acinetobacter gyllenbergii]WEI19702.1 hypothetical protein PY247_07565 [Acinetobacter proteolyticus]